MALTALETPQRGQRMRRPVRGTRTMVEAENDLCGATYAKRNLPMYLSATSAKRNERTEHDRIGYYLHSPTFPTTMLCHFTYTRQALLGANDAV